MQVLWFASGALQMTGVAYLLFVYEELGFSPGTLGMLFAIGAASSLLGAVTAERFSERFGLGPTMIGGVALLSLTLLVLPFAPGATLVGALCIAIQQGGDGFYVLYDVGQTSLRQRMTPDALFGRVNASERFVRAVAMLTGVVLGGVLGEVIGLRATLWIAGAVPLLGALWLVRSPVRKERPGKSRDSA